MRIIIYSRRIPSQNGTEAELSTLRKIVVNRGDTVVGIHEDDPAITGKGRYEGWRKLIAGLGDADVVLIPSVFHIPPKPLNELYKTLAVFQGNGISLHLHEEGIDTGTSAGVLKPIAVYRRAQTSFKIKRGQERARLLGRYTGRPRTPDHVRQTVLAALESGVGVREIARNLKVISPATVINIRKSSEDSTEVLAA
jgi:DNA invertase Pin-like site-specific DNA recombinase